MADKKISALTAATTPLAGTEVLPIVQGGATVKVSVDNLTTGKPVSMSNLTYTGTLTGGTGVVNLGSGQVYKDASGNVGIDTATPAYRLQVRRAGGAGSLGISVDSVGSVQRVAQYFAVGDSTSATTGHAFYTRNGTATDNLAALIDSSGNVGIGTSSPAQKLEVTTGNAQVQNTNTPSLGAVLPFGFTFRGNNQVGQDRGTIAAIKPFLGSAADNDFGLVFQTQASTSGGVTTKVIFAPSGIVTMNAYGAGAATFSASGVISSVSDETWKVKDGVPTNPDEMLQKLEPGYWFYNEEKALVFGVDRQLGFYAQNVNSAIGNEAAPTPEEGKPWGYYDRSVLAITVMSLKNALNTIQEQQILIQNLTTRLDALENAQTVIAQAK